jgi:hypothetical protein
MARPSFGEKSRGGDVRTPGTKDDWLTPPGIIESLGEFDLDPCSPINRPWPTAKLHFTVIDDGLSQDWDLRSPKGSTRVWLNPPYGAEGPRWVRKAVAHGNAIVLLHSRTDAAWFHEAVRACDAILFFKGRIRFHHGDGTVCAGRPAFMSVLVAYGQANAAALAASGIDGLLFQRPLQSPTKK